MSGRTNTVPRVSHCKRIPVRECPGPVIQPPWRRSSSGNSCVWVAQGLCLLPWLRGRSKVSLPGQEIFLERLLRSAGGTCWWMRGHLSLCQHSSSLCCKGAVRARHRSFPLPRLGAVQRALALLRQVNRAVASSPWRCCFVQPCFLHQRIPQPLFGFFRAVSPVPHAATLSWQYQCLPSLCRDGIRLSCTWLAGVDCCNPISFLLIVPVHGGFLVKPHQRVPTEL